MNLTGKEINSCYKIVEKIGENILCRVYKMEGIFSPLKAIFKIFKKSNNEYNLEEIYRFKQKMKGIYNIKHSNINSVYEIDEFEGNTYVIMEYIEGITLNEYLTSHSKLSFSEILSVIISICKGIEVAHRNGVIHNNLNLNNILIPRNGNFLETKITNFGFSDLIMSYHMNDHNFIENILCFLPPEACNFYNKSLDEKSDLFSLGIIFYYLLTNKLPYESDYIEGYFKKIINDDVVPPSKFSTLSFPELIDSMILKLLDIDKKSRYQSALSLLDDLEKINRSEYDFILGEEDLIFDSNFEIDLIGREKELQTLNGIYNDAENKNGQICMVGGIAGIGKEKLLDEFSKNVFKKNGIFIEVKPDELLIKNPYNIFKKIFQNYYDYYEKIDKKNKNNFYKKFSNFLKDKYPLFLNLSGNFSLKKNMKIKQNNFYSEFINFFFDFINNQTTFAVLIKNTEMIDKDSIKILELLHEQLKDRKILLIYSYNSDFNKNKFIKKMLSNDNIKKINLEVFNKEKISKLINNIFEGAHFNTPAKLINFIYKNSGGIPYYAIEIVRQLINKEIVFPIIDKWEVDLVKLEKIFWQNRTDIISDKIQLLKKIEIEILYNAVIMDTDFNIDTLFKILNTDKIDIITFIDYLVNQEILKVEFSGNNHKYSVNNLVKTHIKNKIHSQLKNKIQIVIANFFEKEFKKDKNYENLIVSTCHYLKSKNINKSFKYLLKISDYFKKIYGFYESAFCYKTCLKLIKYLKINDKKKIIQKINKNLLIKN